MGVSSANFFLFSVFGGFLSVHSYVEFEELQDVPDSRDEIEDHAGREMLIGESSGRELERNSCGDWERRDSKWSQEG